MILYKILRSDEFDKLEKVGKTLGSNQDKKDGFIHLSTKKQLYSTLEKHFHLETDLVLMAIKTELVQEGLKWELSRNNQLFPHLYSFLFFNYALWFAPIAFIDGRHIIPSGA